MYWRRFKVSDIPISDPSAFEIWLTARWLEKDELIEHYHTHGRFPADDGANVDPKDASKMVRGAGLIETQVKATKWHDFLQVFAPMDALSLIPDGLQGALPKLSASIVERVNGYRAAYAESGKKQVAAAPKSAVANTPKSAVATAPKSSIATAPKSSIASAPKSAVATAPKSVAAKPPMAKAKIVTPSKVASPGAVLPRSSAQKIVPKKKVPTDDEKSTRTSSISKPAMKTAGLVARTMTSPNPPPFKKPVVVPGSATKSVPAKGVRRPA